MLVLKDLVGLQKPFNFSFFRVTGWGIDLDYCDIEWFALEMNRDYSVVFEIAPKYYVSDSFFRRVQQKTLVETGRFCDVTDS